MTDSTSDRIEAALTGNPESRLAGMLLLDPKAASSLLAGDYARPCEAAIEGGDGLDVMDALDRTLRDGGISLLRRACLGGMLRAHGARIRNAEHLEALDAHHTQLRAWAAELP